MYNVTSFDLVSITGVHFTEAVTIQSAESLHNGTIKSVSTCSAPRGVGNGTSAPIRVMFAYQATSGEITATELPVAGQLTLAVNGVRSTVSDYFATSSRAACMAVEEIRHS